MRRALAAALAAVLACARPAGPVAAYRAFVAAARRGDADGAWALLAKRSRAALDARATAVAAASGGVVPASAKELLLGDAATRAPRIEEVLVLRESADAAVLKIALHGGGEGEVSLVREGGRWRVVLPEAPAAAR